MSKITAKPPKQCNFCETSFDESTSEVHEAYDFKTIYGPWAWGCRRCFSTYGFGLGTGKGQKYVYNEEDKAWYKEEG